MSFLKKKLSLNNEIPRKKIDYKHNSSFEFSYIIDNIDLSGYKHSLNHLFLPKDNFTLLLIVMMEVKNLAQFFVKNLIIIKLN